MLFRRLLSLAVVVTLLGAHVGAAEAKAPKKPIKVAAATATKGSRKGPRSIGAPNAGHLEGALLLKGSRTLKQKEGSHSWALPELVRLLQRAAAKVAKKHKNSVMLVGDLSGRTGGFLERHGSHQSGRDADVGFYVMNSKSKPVNVRHFVAFDASGKGRELPWAMFDDARNWDLVEALLQDDKATVRYLFLTPPLRARLLAQAARKHAHPETIARAAAAMISPQEDVHDDHVHVRLACPESMRDVCIEEAMPRVGGGGDGGSAKSARAAVDTDSAEEKPSEAKPVAEAPPSEAK